MADDLTRGSEGSALPIVAIIAGAVVGVVSPLAVAAVARRSRRELDASAARQRAALDAEGERLQTTLRAESARQRREVERTLLDHGTVLISEFRDAVADVTLDPRGRPVVTDSWRKAVHALVAFRGRLLMWFNEGSEIIDGFDGVAACTAWGTTWATELRGGERKVRLTPPPQGGSEDFTDDFPELALVDVDMRHLRYVLAARAYLSGE
jgi:hypothetical protein